MPYIPFATLQLLTLDVPPPPRASPTAPARPRQGELPCPRRILDVSFSFSVSRRPISPAPLGMSLYITKHEYCTMHACGYVWELLKLLSACCLSMILTARTSSMHGCHLDPSDSHCACHYALTVTSHLLAPPHAPPRASSNAPSTLAANCRSLPVTPGRGLPTTLSPSGGMGVCVCVAIYRTYPAAAAGPPCPTSSATSGGRSEAGAARRTGWCCCQPRSNVNDKDGFPLVLAFSRYQHTPTFPVPRLPSTQHTTPHHTTPHHTLQDRLTSSSSTATPIRAISAMSPRHPSRSGGKANARTSRRSCKSAPEVKLSTSDAAPSMDAGRRPSRHPDA